MAETNTTTKEKEVQKTPEQIAADKQQADAKKPLTNAGIEFLKRSINKVPKEEKKGDATKPAEGAETKEKEKAKTTEKPDGKETEKKKETPKTETAKKPAAA